MNGRYLSSIEDKIVQVERKYAVLGNIMLNDAEIRHLLNKLDSAIKSTRKYMQEIGVTEVCRECALQGKSCCKKWVENEYDEVILLINRLLGVDLPTKRFDPKGCFFVGPNGCVLKAREVICVDFLCEKILKHIGKKEIQLQIIAGEELETLFTLREKVTKVIQNQVMALERERIYSEGQIECNSQTIARRKRIHDESM